MEFLEHGRAVLAAQPFSQMVGAELTRFVPGEAEIALPVTDQLKQQNGFVHGGVLAYLADTALTFAGGSVLKGVLTSEIKVNYTRPGLGQRLIARASVLSHGKTQAVCRCDIFALQDGAEKLCAAAQGTIVKVSLPD
ncbi:PaaI family thioesterase [Pseudodonghicola flavimaris]|uniref:Medium/long-chain acyl-CoA thioesterase YigI n=1 Tax=Pseudodonghicola flavimaris TaxID=3050036 RepID=A0ABT7EYY6_9RHOB|nr:PaaI family thioesterase [Pseudodonghicola flavimaris]MDK3017566.1 PaaI family thioesterase [Pseudodonghicola flavimaris]